MKRIMILGNPGSGKSTLSDRLGSILNIPVIHLDKLFWQPGWQEMEPKKWANMQTELVAGDKWIIDGNYFTTIERRLPHADTIIYLNFSTGLSLRRIFKRIFTNLGKNRPDMGDGCPEKIDFVFLKFALSFNKQYKPVLESRIKQYFIGDFYYELKKPSMVESFIREIESNQPTL